MNGIITMLLATMRRIGRGEKGLASIPLIVGAVSTVAVGATLAGTVINAGSSASQNVDTALHNAIQNVQGTVMIRGNVLGKAATTGPNGKMGQIMFTVSLATTGGSIDFTPPTPDPANTGLADPNNSTNAIVISYTDKYQHVDNLYWTINRIGRNDGTNMLIDNEMFQVVIGGSPTPGVNGGNLVNALGKPLSTYTAFEIEMKTAQGQSAMPTIQWSTPPNFDPVINFGY
jgi:archaellin